MHERAGEAFQAYVELGPRRRTLAKVAQILAGRGESVSLVTLKRWSTRFRWQTIIRQQEEIAARAFCRRIAARASANFEPPPEQALKGQCEDIAVLCGTLSNLRENFAKRIQLSMDDTNGVKLTPDQFLKICREELALRRRLDHLQASAMRDSDLVT
jgi:hypothetical protein